MKKLDKPVGAVWCCGVEPEYGRHKHHKYGGRDDLDGFGFWCPKCYRSVSVLGRGNFALFHWNTRFNEPGCTLHYGEKNRSGCDLDLPNPYKGWLFGGMVVMSGNHMDDHGNVWRNYTHNFDAVLFKTSRRFPEIIFGNDGYESTISEEKTLQDLEIVNPEYGVQVTVPLKVRKNGYSNAYIGRVFDADGCYYKLYIGSEDRRYDAKLYAAMVEAGYLIRKDTYYGD
jgi:hypothetical protein